MGRQGWHTVDRHNSTTQAARAGGMWAQTFSVSSAACHGDRDSSQQHSGLPHLGGFVLKRQVVAEHREVERAQAQQARHQGAAKAQHALPDDAAEQRLHRRGCATWRISTVSRRAPQAAFAQAAHALHSCFEAALLRLPLSRASQQR